METPDMLGKDEDRSDDVLNCLVFLAEHFGQTTSALVLRSGLAADEAGYLPFHQVEPALGLLGLKAVPITRKLVRIAENRLPAIISLRDGGAVVVLEKDGDEFVIHRPGFEELQSLAISDLAAEHGGETIAVSADATKIRQHERPWDTAQKSHWFWDEMRKESGAFKQVAGAALFINLLGFALPLFTMNVYDRVIPNKAAATLWVLAIGVFLAFMLEFGMRLARARLIDETGRKLDAKLSQKLFEKIVNIPLGSRSGSTGAMVRRVSEYEIVRDFFASTTIVLIIDMLFLVIFVALIAVIAGWLALVPVVMIIIMLVAGYVLQKKMGVAAFEAQADSSLQHSMLVESIAGIETLKACGAEGRMLSRWRNYAQMSADTQEKMRRLGAVAINLASLCQQTTSISLIIGGFYLFNAGIISMGAIIAIVMLAGRSLSPVGQLAFLMTRGRQAFLTLDSIQTMTEQVDERGLGSRSITPEVGAGKIVFDDVSFAYPEADTESLSSLNVTFKPGERVAVIGRVASGKSTLGRLICGLYPPASGAIMVDGLDSRQYPPRILRSVFRYVGQDSELFSGSIKENLTLGAAKSDPEHMMAVLRKSGADQFLARDAVGFDRLAGERGARLSGGQRSFLVLARALMSPFKLLYLDEPTGAMDVQTERQFIDHLKNALEPDQTLVISTHRQAILSIVDRIIVMDQGRIVADGPRDEILSRVGNGEKLP
jgi:ATP-binding cassette subfamily C protein LapB